jgi:hypothetical protein
MGLFRGNFIDSVQCNYVPLVKATLSRPYT